MKRGDNVYWNLPGSKVRAIRVHDMSAGLLQESIIFVSKEYSENPDGYKDCIKLLRWFTILMDELTYKQSVCHEIPQPTEGCNDIWRYNGPSN